MDVIFYHLSIIWFSFEKIKTIFDHLKPSVEIGINTKVRNQVHAHPCQVSNGRGNTHASAPPSLPEREESTNPTAITWPYVNERDVDVSFIKAFVAPSEKDEVAVV